MWKAALAVMAGVLVTTGAAFGQETPAGSTDLRYRLEKTETGFIRLDQQTGAVSFCREETGGLTCRLAADERQAFEQELDMLERRVDALEKTVTAPAPSGLASEAEIEQSLTIMERFMRRFMGLIEEFQEERGDIPNRT